MSLVRRVFGALKGMGRFLGQTFNKILSRIQRSLSICALFYRLLMATFSGPRCFRIMAGEIAKQVYFTAIQGVHVLVFSALILGLVVIVHATQQLVKIQGEEFIGWLLVTIVVREVGPVWAAFFVLIRSGSAITVEIGTMSVTGELEAMKMMGVDPYRYLGVPRFWGLIISLVAMYVLCMFAAVLGGFLFSQIFADIFWSKFWMSFIQALQWLDLSVGFTKVTLFGALIATVSLYFGFSSEKQVEEIAKNTSAGGLLGLVLCASADIIITSAYYL